MAFLTGPAPLQGALVRSRRSLWPIWSKIDLPFPRLQQSAVIILGQPPRQNSSKWMMRHFGGLDILVAIGLISEGDGAVLEIHMRESFSSIPNSLERGKIR